MSQAPHDPAEERARVRYMALNALRVMAVAAVIAGIAGARNVLPLPYPVAVGIAICGLLAFFFGPSLLVRRWKAGDREETE